MAEILSLDDIKQEYIHVDKEQFYNFIGSKTIQMDIQFCKTDEIYYYTRFSLPYPFSTIALEVSLHKKRDGKHIKEYYIKNKY